MSNLRLRCTNCDRIVDPTALCDDRWSTVSNHKWLRPHHKSWRSCNGRVVYDDCGPVIEETPSEHHLCIEALLGEII